MTLTHTRGLQSAPRFGTVDHLLESGLRSLDITQAEERLVVDRYADLGAAFEEHWEQTESSNTVFPQGSFSLGTVTRRIHHGDDVDIDLVAARELSRESISQAELKSDAGLPVKHFSRQCLPSPRVEESDRCWTLTFPGMHMDVLPALVDQYQPPSLLITDRAVRAWQQSDPRGFASWFHSQIAPELLEARQELAKNTDVEEVPVFNVKSNLQRIVQALKRHRDIHFTNNLDDRPTSIVITTLAAMAYATVGRADLYDSLRMITREMPQFIRKDSSGWYLGNPAQPDENFTDYWNHDPRLANNFAQWAAAAAQDFDSIGIQSGMHNVLPKLGRIFGARTEEHAARVVGESAYAARSSGSLSATTTSGVAARSVKSHGFFGGSV